MRSATAIWRLFGEKKVNIEEKCLIQAFWRRNQEITIWISNIFNKVARVMFDKNSFLFLIARSIQLQSLGFLFNRVWKFAIFCLKWVIRRWKLSKLKVAKIESWQNFRLPKLKVDKIEKLLNCQNLKLPKFIVAKLLNCSVVKLLSC